MWIVINNVWEINKIAGLLKLSNDVRACEYEDIQVMWEILNRNESEFGRSSSTRKGNNKKGHCWKLLRWARCAPCMCRTWSWLLCTWEEKNPTYVLVWFFLLQSWIKKGFWRVCVEHGSSFLLNQPTQPYVNINCIHQVRCVWPSHTPSMCLISVVSKLLYV